MFRARSYGNSGWSGYGSTSNNNAPSAGLDVVRQPELVMPDGSVIQQYPTPPSAYSMDAMANMPHVAANQLALQRAAQGVTSSSSLSQLPQHQDSIAWRMSKAISMSVALTVSQITFGFAGFAQYWEIMHEMNAAGNLKWVDGVTLFVLASLSICSVIQIMRGYKDSYLRSIDATPFNEFKQMRQDMAYSSDMDGASGGVVSSGGEAFDLYSITNRPGDWRLANWARQWMINMSRSIDTINTVVYIIFIAAMFGVLMWYAHDKPMNWDNLAYSSIIFKTIPAMLQRWTGGILGSSAMPQAQPPLFRY